LAEDIEPEVFGPVRGDWGEKQALQLDVEGDEVGVHADAGGAGHVAVEVAGSGEVVEAGFEGGFVR